MKHSAITAIVLSFLFCSCHTHKSIPDFNQLKTANGNFAGSEHTLVIYAAIGCGYSQAAIKKLQAYESCKEFQMIVIEDDSLELIKEHQGKYFANTAFYSNEDGKVKFKNFFPQYFLYRNKKLIWKKKGYAKNANTILDAKMECSP